MHDDFEIMTVHEDLEEYKTDYQMGRDAKSRQYSRGESRKDFNRGNSKYLSNGPSPQNSNGLSKFYKVTKVNSKGESELDLNEPSNIDSVSNN